jgi:hypothetical protein
LRQKRDLPHKSPHNRLFEAKPFRTYWTLSDAERVFVPYLKQAGQEFGV